MRLRFTTTRACTIGDTPIPAGAVVDLDDEAMDSVVAIRLPHNPGALLGLLVDGSIQPIDLSPSAARDMLTPPPPPADSRVLAFRRPRRQA